MRIGVFGSGAMGSLFAARLAPVVDVVLIGTWVAQLAAIATHGLRLTMPDGRQMVSLPTAALPSAAPQVDLALVVVKSYQTVRTAEHVAALLRKKGSAVTLQNGLGNAEQLAATLGAARVLTGTTSLGASLTGLGAVRQVGEEPVVLPSVGPADVSALANLLQTAGFTVARRAAVDRLVWEKLAVNAAINPPTALFDVDNGLLAALPAGRLLLTIAAQETARVAAALGVPLAEEAAARRALAVARATAANRSSMRQDLARGAPTEIDAICGAIITRAEAACVDVPLARLYLALVTLAATQGRHAALQELARRQQAADPAVVLLCEFQLAMEQEAS